MIISENLQPSKEITPIGVSGAIKTTAKATAVVGLREDLKYNGAKILGANTPLNMARLKVFVNAPTAVTMASEKPEADNPLIIKCYTGDSSSTVTKQIDYIELTASEVNKGRFFYVDETRVNAYFKFEVTAGADSVFSAGEVAIVVEVV